MIQEVAIDGTEQFLWNSWDHLQLEPDCGLVRKAGRDTVDYAHLNSLQLVDGDVIASFRGCSQVLRIDRSSGTGAVEWQLGGTSPPRASGTEYLELAGDPSGEFCRQHQATLTGSDTVVLFDNGTGCLGPRKDEAIFSRIVEYDISSGTQVPSGSAGWEWSDCGVLAEDDEPSTIDPLQYIDQAGLQGPWCGLTNAGWQSLVAGEMEASLDDGRIRGRESHFQ